MALTISSTLTITGKDTLQNTTTYALLEGNVSDVAIDSGMPNILTVASGATVDLFPDSYIGSTCEYIGFVQYDQAETTMTAGINPDGLAAPCIVGQYFGAIANTTMTFTNNGAQSAKLKYYVFVRS